LRRSWVFVVAILVAAACTRLGLWQLNRLEQRRVRNTVSETRLALPVVELPTAENPDSLRYRRAQARGVFDFERELVVVARSRRGVPAVHIVTPLRLRGGNAVLVERGLALSPDARTVDLNALNEPDTSSASGVLLSLELGDSGSAGWPRLVRGVDPMELQRFYPYRLFPLVLRRTTAPATGPADLTPVPLPQRTNGPHLSYALQWFSFAAIALIGSWFLYRGLGRRSVDRSAPATGSAPAAS
jgi:surfeit locus 1 family protein